MMINNSYMFDVFLLRWKEKDGEGGCLGNAAFLSANSIPWSNRMFNVLSLIFYVHNDNGNDKLLAANTN